ncbi:MAG TPA: cupin domain-containing protein [Thermoanaerobaculia bacterium]
MESVAQSFETLIDPVTPDAFFKDYWEKQHLHLERNRPSLYDDLFSLGDVDRWILSTRQTDQTDAILVAPPEGTEVSQQRYRAGELPIEVAYEVFTKGYSLVLNRLENTWQPVARLTEMLGQVFCARIGVNAYLTPVGSKTFPVHIDNHDVFILQVYGEKVWQLHEFEHLPIYYLEYREYLKLPSFWNEPGSFPHRAEIRLRPGDLLYIPRGMPHCARAIDSTSLHLTASINPLYWTDFFKAAVEQTCFDVPLLRRALPPRFVSDPEAREAMRRDFLAALALFTEKVSFEETLGVVTRRQIHRQGFPQDGHLAQLLRLAEVALDSRIERRPGILCAVEVSPRQDTCRIRFGPTYVRGPIRLRAAMEFICDHERFRVSDLPGLDDSGKVVLARRLVGSGLLRLDAGAASAPPPAGAGAS